MKLTARSTLVEVAARVASVLAAAKIRAVLTGGACASLYSRGEYQSFDLDFILQSVVSAERLDSVMKSIGFRRDGNRYVHPRAPFFIEFPAGPLGIGADIDIRPVVYRVRGVRLRALSATDSCRDRLAAFYHWNDRQSLKAAVGIARRRRVNLDTIRRWSEREGESDRYGGFLALLRQARRSGRRR